MGKFVGFVLLVVVWQHAWAACDNGACSTVSNGLLQTKRGRSDETAILELNRSGSTGHALPPQELRTPEHIPLNTARNGALWKPSQIASGLIEIGHEINNTHGRALLSTRRTMDESLHRKGSPRRRERHTHPDASYRITNSYQDHYDRCRSELYPEQGYSMMSEFVYAKLILWEDMDCRGARHEFHMSNTIAPGSTPNYVPDIIKAQHHSDGEDKISSYGFSMNYELLFDGKREGGDDDGTPWLEMANPHDHELFVQGAGPPEDHVTGTYTKQSGNHNGRPYWRKGSNDVYLYSCPSGTWMVGQRSAMTRSMYSR
jgi:hypothetical protein